MKMQPPITIGILLMLIGFAVLVAGILLSGQSEVKGGAIIFIGPIPIAFGTDRNSLLSISILMMVLMLIAYLFLRQ